MSKLSTSRSRALRRSFWGSPALTAIGRTIDRYSDGFVALTVCLLVLVFVPVLGTLHDFPLTSSVASSTPSPAPSRVFGYVEVVDQFDVMNPTNNWEQLHRAYNACRIFNEAEDSIDACQWDAYQLAMTAYKP